MPANASAKAQELVLCNRGLSDARKLRLLPDVNHVLQLGAAQYRIERGKPGLCQSGLPTDVTIHLFPRCLVRIGVFELFWLLVQQL